MITLHFPDSLFASTSCTGLDSPWNHTVFSVGKTLQEKSFCAEEQPGLSPCLTLERISFVSATAWFVPFHLSWTWCTSHINSLYSSSMLSIFSSDLQTHVYTLWIQSRVPGKMPEFWDTVVRPVHKVLACSLVCAQPIPACQLEIPRKNSQALLETRNSQEHTFFYRIPFACSCPVLKADGHYQLRPHTVYQMNS